MREIKFRAWDESTSSMKYIEKPSSFKFWVCGSSDGGIDRERTLTDINLMQYTGLKDKNGKEIYEGDICFCNYGTGEYSVVKYIDGCFFLCDLHRDNQDFPIYDLIKDDNGNIKPEEIIGNIYENPDLLK